MTISLRRAALVAAVLGLALGAAGRAEADQAYQPGSSPGGPSTPVVSNVVINDLTDHVTATINGTAVTLLPDSTGEFIHFHVQLSAPSLVPNDSASINLLDDPNPTHVSDRLFASNLLASNIIDVKFGSDPNVALAPVSPNNVFGPVVETGTPQDLFNFTGFNDVVNFTVTSDVEVAAPEPSTLIGGSIASLLGLAFAWRRRRAT
jgi:hypothetical protein